MVKRSSKGIGVALVVLAAACGGSSEPPKTAEKGTSTTAPADADAGATTAIPAPAASAEPAKPRRKPFEIHNACTDVATIVFGENATAPNAYQRKLAPSTDAEGPRDDDGNQTVWLLDEHGDPLVKVRVTRGMKRVEIGRSCRTLDAR